VGLRPTDSNDLACRRQAGAQERAVEVALVRLLDLGVGEQVVEEVGAADGVDVVVGLGPAGVARESEGRGLREQAGGSSSILRRTSWHFFLITPGAGVPLSRSKSISVCWVTPNSVNRS